MLRNILTLRFLPLLVLATTFLLPGCAAKSTPEAATPTHDRAKTMHLLNVLEVENVMDQYAQLLAPTMADMMKGEHSKLPDKVVDIIFAETMTILDEAKGELMAGFAEIYERHYTPDEIISLTKVMQMPVMKKNIALQTVLMQEGGELGQKVMLSKMPVMQARLMTRLKAMYPEGIPGID